MKKLFRRKLNRKTPEMGDGFSELFNFAYVKDREVWLRMTDLGYPGDMRLTTYIAYAALEHGCEGVTPEDVLYGDSCCDCDCPVALMNRVAICAAELWARVAGDEKAAGRE